jgi:PAS domain S-box-containing protein
LRDPRPFTIGEIRWLHWTGVPVVVVGLIVVAGWLTDIQRLTTFVGGGSPVVMNTAICLIVCGAGLVALSGGCFRCAVVGGIFVVTLTTITVAQFFLGRAVGIDELFWKHQFVTSLTLPGRMAPHTAVALWLVGCSIVLRARGWSRHWLLPVMGGVVVAFALLPLLDFLTLRLVTDTTVVYRGMAVPTAGCLILLAAAILRPAKSKENEGSASWPFLAAALGMLASIGIVLLQNNGDLIAANRMVTHTFEVRGTVDAFIAAEAREESNTYAFVLTGEETFTAGVADQRVETVRLIEALKQLVARNREQLERVNSLAGLAERKFAGDERIVQARQNQGREAAEKLLFVPGLSSTGSLESLAETIRTEEDKLLAVRNVQRFALERDSRIMEIFGGLIALGLLGASVSTARRSTAAKKLAESSLITANQLQRAVLDGTRFGVIATKLDGTIQVFNAGAEKMLGHTRTEMVGRRTLEFVHVPGEIKARAGELTVLLGRRVEPGLEAFTAQAKLGRADEREWTYVRKDGSKLPVLVSITPLTDPSGLITGFLSVAQDLTDSKRMEVAVQVGEERLHRVLSHADCLVWEANVTLTGADWSWAMTVHPSGLYRRLSGEKDGGASAGLWYQFEIPEREEMNRRCRTAMETGAAGYEQEFRLLRKGRISWIKESVSITPTAPGHFWVVGVAVDATESKRVRAARDEIVARLHKWGALVPGMIYQFRLRPDGSSCFPYASEGIRQVYRVSPEEVREDASKVFAVLHPEDVAAVTESIHLSARSLQIWQHEYRVRYSDGTVRWLLGNSVPEREADGSVLWHGFINDITQRKEAEKALRESEEQLRSFAQLAPVGICRTDEKGRALYVNERWCEISGRNAVETLGTNWGMTLHPDDRRKVFEAWAALTRGAEESSLEYRFRHPRGRVVWVAGAAISLRNEQGVITGFLGTVTDISLAKMAKAAMEESEERFRQAFEFAGIGMAIIGLDGRWVRVNRAICDIVGYSAEDLMRKTFQDITHPADLNADLHHVKQLLDGVVKSYRMEKRYIHRNGQIVWIHLTASLVRDAAGTPVYFVSQIEDVTIQKKLERELRESEERVRLAASVAGVGVWDFDLKTRRITWDSQMFALYGVAPTEDGKVAYSVWAGALSPEELAQQEAAVHNEALQKGSWEQEFHIRRYSDKAVRVIQASKIIVKNEAGEAIRIVGVNRDVTELRQNEAILRTSEERLSNIHRAMADGLVLQDDTARILECNPAAERILGLNRDQIMGRTSLDPRWRTVRSDGTPFPGDEHPAVVTIRTGQAVRNFEMGVCKPDGSVTWISINTEPLAVTSAGVREVICSFSDITERKNLEESVRRERELLRTVIDLLPSPIYLKDRESRFLMVNQALARCLAKDSPAQLVSLCDFDLFDSDVAAAFRADDEAVLAGRPVRGKEETTVFPNGEKRTYMTTKVPFRDAHGNITGILGIGVDITERRQLQDSLALARDAALEASRLKSEFLANMSHEIRTPMNGIVGMAELLMDSPLDDDQREMGRVIQKSAENLLGIINDILDFSKIEAGKLRIEPHAMELRAVVDDAIVLLLPMAEKKHLELACEFDPALEGPLLGDSGRIRQVLLNLAGNAVKFTLKGRVSIFLRRLEERATERVVEVRIQDTGIGISHAAQRQLFQAFTQADGSTTRRFGGTGLGLAISRQLVELMGGEIGLVSEEGHGSTFWFRLMLPKVSRETESPQAIASGCGPTDRIPPGLRFLVAEDNLTNQMVARGFLEKMGHQADFAANGNEVFEMLNLKSYDAILMDCQMPEMDGYTATRKIRADELERGSPPIPIIAVTAFAMPADRAKCLEAGMNDYLPKPLRAEELQQALLRSNLAQRNGHARVDAPAAESGSASSVDALAADHLAQLRGLPGRDGSSLLEEVAEIFLRETPDWVLSLVQMASHQAYAETARLAHRLAGSAASIGGMQMQAAARAVESAAARGEALEVTEALAKLDREWQRVRSALELLHSRSP